MPQNERTAVKLNARALRRKGFKTQKYPGRISDKNFPVPNPRPAKEGPESWDCSTPSIFMDQKISPVPEQFHAEDKAKGSPVSLKKRKILMGKSKLVPSTACLSAGVATPRYETAIQGTVCLQSPIISNRRKCFNGARDPHLQDPSSLIGLTLLRFPIPGIPSPQFETPKFVRAFDLVGDVLVRRRPPEAFLLRFSLLFFNLLCCIEHSFPGLPKTPG